MSKKIKKIIKEEIVNVIKENNDKIMRDVLALSSGTIATLTGFKKYSDIDKIINAWIDYIEDTYHIYNNWMDAWNEFEKSKAYKSLIKKLK